MRFGLLPVALGHSDLPGRVMGSTVVYIFLEMVSWPAIARRPTCCSLCEQMLLLILFFHFESSIRPKGVQRECALAQAEYRPVVSSHVWACPWRSMSIPGNACAIPACCHRKSLDLGCLHASAC